MLRRTGPRSLPCAEGVAAAAVQAWEAPVEARQYQPAVRRGALGGAVLLLLPTKAQQQQHPSMMLVQSQAAAHDAMESRTQDLYVQARG